MAVPEPIEVEPIIVPEPIIEPEPLIIEEVKVEIPVEPVPIVVEVALPEEPTKKVEEGIQKTISMFMKSKSQIEVKQELMSHYNIKRSQDSFSEIYKAAAVFKVNEDKA